jgi:hypothetical protein
MVQRYLSRAHPIYKILLYDEVSKFIDKAHKYLSTHHNYECFKSIMENSHDANKATWDILILNLITLEHTRLQVKYRYGDIHLETTRRHSSKNIGNNSTGHIVYSKTEFDYLWVVKGEMNSYINLSLNSLIFDVNLLIDKTHPELLVSRIGSRLITHSKNNYLKTYSLLFK